MPSACTGVRSASTPGRRSRPWWTGYRDGFDLRHVSRAVAALPPPVRAVPALSQGRAAAFLAMKGGGQRPGAGPGRPLHHASSAGPAAAQCRDYAIPGADVRPPSGGPGGEVRPHPQGLPPPVGQDPESPAVRPSECLRQPQDRYPQCTEGRALPGFSAPFFKISRGPSDVGGIGDTRQMVRREVCAHYGHRNCRSPPGKGGTGKTSITGGVAASLAAPGAQRAVHRHGHRPAQPGHLPWASATGP